MTAQLDYDAGTRCPVCDRRTTASVTGVHPVTARREIAGRTVAALLDQIIAYQSRRT